VYQCPLADIAAVNQGIDVMTALPNETRVRIPDPRWTTMLASFLASRVMVAPAFSAEDRRRLIASLAVPAASNPTALDTILARLLIVLAPEGDEELARLERIVQRYPGSEGAAALASPHARGIIEPQAT
jgi:hypothetical protein